MQTRGGDTLFLSVEKPSAKEPRGAYETIEGHAVEFDEQGALLWIGFLDVRWRFAISQQVEALLV